MKFKGLFFLTTIAFTSNLYASQEEESCVRYAVSLANEENLQEIKTVDPTQTELSAAEKGMVLQAVLVSGNDVLSYDQAMEEYFLDLDNDGQPGSNRGSLTYVAVPKDDGTTETVVVTRWYPGDNEYGALFSSRGGLIGTISDGDIACLSYQ